MSLGIYPVFDPQVSGIAFAGGEVLADEFQALDELADEHQLVPLGSFADTREIPEGFDGSPEELLKLMGPCDQWHACRDGVKACEALVRLIRDSPDVAASLDAAEAAAVDLQALARALAMGEAKGARFRLEMS